MLKHERITALIYDFFVKETQRTPDLRAGWEQIAPLAVQLFDWRGLALGVIGAIEEQKDTDDLIIREDTVSIGYRREDLTLTKNGPRIALNIDFSDWDTGEFGPMLRKGLHVEVDRQFKTIEIGFNEDIPFLLAMKAGVEAFFDAEWRLGVNEQGIYVYTGEWGNDNHAECKMLAEWSDNPITRVETRDKLVEILRALQFDEDGIAD